MNYTNDTIMLNLEDIASLRNGWDISKHIHKNKNGIHIWNKKDPVVSFSRDGIHIGNTEHTFELPQSQKQWDSRQGMLWQVLDSLWTNNISLNHVGIGYNTEDIDEEVKKIVDIVKSSSHKIYEDPEGKKENMRRLFVGDAEKNNPMFEIVLPDKELQIRPHMQFDVDTDLSPEEIQERVSNYFGEKMLQWYMDDYPEFEKIINVGTRMREKTSHSLGGKMLDWHLDIPEVGRILYMGTYENSFLDMRIWIWTNLRSRKAHRKSMIEL